MHYNTIVKDKSMKGNGGKRKVEHFTRKKDFFRGKKSFFCNNL